MSMSPRMTLPTAENALPRLLFRDSVKEMARIPRMLASTIHAMERGVGTVRMKSPERKLSSSVM